MPSRIVAEQLLKNINRLELFIRRKQDIAIDAQRQAATAEKELATFLANGHKLGIEFETVESTEARRLVNPVYGWDEELAMEHRSA